MKKILVATDFSENANVALAHATALAQADQGHIYLLHTYLPRYVEPGIYSDAQALQEAFDEQHSALQSKMVSLSNNLDAAGVASTALLEMTDVASGVFDAVEKFGIDLIVMGRTGSGGFFDKLIGSNAAHITAKANIPVLTIPAQTQVQEVKHIVYATQLEFEEIAVLQQVFDLAHQLKAQVSLVKVNAPFEPDVHSDNQYIKEINEAFVKEDFTLQQVAANSVAEGILVTAQAKNADLIVLAAHHRNFLTQLIDPSKSQQVIVRAAIPVLTFQL